LLSSDDGGEILTKVKDVTGSDVMKSGRVPLSPDDERVEGLVRGED